MDEDAVNLAKAIRQTESGGDFNAKGKSGESGAYQWTPETWKAHAKEALGDENAQMTPENQNAVAYTIIKKRKDAGLNAAQIAAEWNSGSSTDWENKVGTNKFGVHYDVPQYVKSVTDTYHQYKSGQVNPTISPNSSSVGPTTGYNPKPFSTAPGQFDFSGTPLEAPKDTSFLGEAGSAIGGAATGVASAATRAASGEINPLSGLIQAGGAIGKGIGDLTNTALTHTPIVGGLVKAAENVVGAGAQKLAGTGLGKSAISGYQGFAQKHLELANDIESVGNIATAVPILKGAGLAKDAIAGAIGKGLVGSTDAIVEAVAPKLSAKETAEAIAKRGTSQQGLLRKTVLNPDKRVQEVADAVKQNVPDFNPSKPLVHNISATQQVVDDMGKKLKQEVIANGENRIYPFRELESRLQNIERPLLVSSDATLNNAYNRVIGKAMEIIKSNGGKVSNLLDARQEFDGFIARQFPNLYSSETLTPMRQAVKDIRNEITNFTAENLPEVQLRDSLLTQHKLITAIENMAEKASSGEAKEIGSTALDRLAGRHPVVSGLIKKGTRYGVEGLGVGTGMGLFK